MEISSKMTFSGYWWNLNQNFRSSVLFLLYYNWFVDSSGEFTHILQGYFTDPGAIVWFVPVPVSLKDMGKIDQLWTWRQQNTPSANAVQIFPDV